MYLLLFALLLIITNFAPSSVVRAVAPYWWVGVLAAEHVFAYLVARKFNGAAEYLVNLAVLDFVVGAFAGFLLLDHYFVLGFFAAIWGLVLCVGAYHFQRQGYTGSLPLRGEWARRFRIGWGLLLMQAVAPSTLAAFAFRNDFSKPQPFVSASLLQGLAVAWVLTLPLHYAPLYLTLCRGARPGRDLASSKVPTSSGC